MTEEANPPPERNRVRALRRTPGVVLAPKRPGDPRGEIKDERKDKKTVYTECSHNQLLRVIDLPATVEAEQAEASLNNGVLELRLRKAGPLKKVPVSVKEPNQDREH
jgi:hypothetical protein